jgi:hypothetical protein
VGADLTFEYEVNQTGMAAIAAPTGQANSLPTAAFRQFNLNVFSKYALDKSADIKVSLVHQRYYSNEWYWNNNGTSFFFSDGTTVTQKDQQVMRKQGTDHGFLKNNCAKTGDRPRFSEK